MRYIGVVLAGGAALMGGYNLLAVEEGRTVSILTLVTITSVVATWTNVALVLVVIAIGLLLLSRGRKELYQIILDMIQLYSRWQQAKIDADYHRLKLKLYQDEAHLLVREHRHHLLAELETIEDEAAKRTAMLSVPTVGKDTKGTS